MTPEEKLCSRKWRLLNSAGVLWSVLSFGLLTCVNFLVRGSKSRNRLWIIYGVGFAILSVVVLSWSSNVNSGTKEAPVSSPESTAWGWFWFLSWITGIVLSVMTNRKWLMWTAHHGNNKWYAQPAPAYGVHHAGPGLQQRQQQGPPTWQHQAQGRQLQDQPYGAQTHPFQQPQHPGPPWPTSTMQDQARPAPSQPTMRRASRPVNVNAALDQDLAALGMDQATAEKILNTRHHIGGYKSFEHLLAATGVAPHILIPLRASLAFEYLQPGRPTPAPDSPKPQGGGRTLDL
jgi:DNA uptake protein ComE-like DNA-binding protein